MPGFKSNLRQPFQMVSQLPVTVNAVRPGMMIPAKVNGQPVFFRQFPVRRPTHNVMPVEFRHPAADKASGIALLDD